MFEQLRRSLDELLARATKPEDRRAALARMKSSLVQARLAMDDLRRALDETRRKLEHEQRELETVRRRKALAQGIRDDETVGIAARFEAQHADRVRVLGEKLAAQESEVHLAERELDEMKAEFKRALASGPTVGAYPLDDPLSGEDGAQVQQELDSLARERTRAERSADADRRLEELKRRMGK